MNGTTNMVQLEQAARVADWIQERYRTNRMREGLKRLLESLDTSRASLDRARTAYREAEAEVARVDATLAVVVSGNPDLKNAEARKAALDAARSSDPERQAAAAALERALEARNEAARQAEDTESLVKATHAAMALATAEIQALSAIIQLPPF